MTGHFGLPFDDAFDEDAPPPGPPAPLTVGELTSRLKHLVESRFTGLLVEGEVSNCRRWSSGHIYFTLKDDGAQLRAVVFRMTARQLKFALEDGLHVVARGRIGVYEVKGEYQLICDAVEPHGLGALQAAFDQLKRRLSAEGLFDATRKRPLPALPRRIGIVTSLDGAAIRDILRVLTVRHPAARVVIRPARVQGEEAPRELVRALERVARVPEVDVVILARGGGSAEDLQAFNDEALARAIAACPVPVIAGVGHEIDVTIADLVADVRASTPSNAAELVVERADHMRTRVSVADARLRRAIERRLDGRAQRTDRLDLRLRQWPVGVLMRDRDVEGLRLRLQQRIAGRLTDARAVSTALVRRLEARDVRRVTADLRTRTVRADARLRAAMTARQQSARRRAGELAATLDALSPLAVLARGYAVCWNEARTGIIRSVAGVAPGAGVRVTLVDGELACRVEEIAE
ncbi:MAG TPA: exodeoxyribonuclease VII large subunit [Vicinamibacterales bacterium]|nr:exodeoxyribonuclease VII large subunit [Vicinamibacterales bacterium]